MDNKELISVVIPTYNRPDRLVNCLRCIQNQNYRPIEVIVVNDGDSLDVKVYKDIKQDKSFSIKLINNEFNSGACISRNKGISIAKGTYLTLCDDDDEFLPNRLSSMLDSLKLASCKGVFSDTFVRYPQKERRTILPPLVNINKILEGNYAGAQIFSKTEYFKNILFDRKLVASQDHDFNTRFILQYGCLEKTSEPTYISYQYSSEERVSNNVILGRFQYYLKHGGRMKWKAKFLFWLKIIFKIIFFKSST